MPTLLPMLLAAAAPAPAVLTTADLPDAQCVATFAYLASKATSAQLDFAKVGLFYYLGRLDARHPGVDLETAMREVSPVIANGYDARLKLCTANLQVVAARLSKAGDALQK